MSPELETEVEVLLSQFDKLKKDRDCMWVMFMGIKFLVARCANDAYTMMPEYPSEFFSNFTSTEQNIIMESLESTRFNLTFSPATKGGMMAMAFDLVE
jgi:hypothetical protein